ncbi:MAG: hypothetical protein QM758_29025 [Armatimonas sp.]
MSISWKALPLPLLGAFILAMPPASAQVASQTSRRLKLAFHQADATDVLRAISRLSGVSVAAAASLKGKLISVRLQDVTAEEALRIVAAASGADLRQVGNTYLIGPAQDLKATRSGGKTEVFPLKYLSPASAKTLIESALPYVTAQPMEAESIVALSGSPADLQEARTLLSQADQPTKPTTELFAPEHVTPTTLQGILKKTFPDTTLDIQGNTLIATGSKDALTKIRALLPSLDVAAANEQRTEIYAIKFSSARSLKDMLTSALPSIVVTPSAESYSPPSALFRPLTSTGFGSATNTLPQDNSSYGGPGLGQPGIASGPSGQNGAQPVVSTTRSRHLILAGTDTDVEKALKLLNEIDTAPAQLEIEARLIDVTLDGDLNAGIQWGFFQQQQGTGGQTQQQETFTQGIAQQKIQEATAPGVLKFGRFQRTPLDLGAQIQMLERTGRSKTLAHPRISVLDNDDANIFIGDVLRFQILASASATAGNAFTVQEVPVGVALLVRPRVNASDEITMKIHPVVSILTTRDSAGLPQTASREADTTLRIKDGETIVIGGLIRDEDLKTIQEVPLLSKIPLFGELFRNRQNSRRRSEVLIFLTPHLIKDGGKAITAAAEKAAPAATNAIKKADGEKKQ